MRRSEPACGGARVEVTFIGACVEIPIAEWRRAAHGE